MNDSACHTDVRLGWPQVWPYSVTDIVSVVSHIVRTLCKEMGQFVINVNCIIVWSSVSLDQISALKPVMFRQLQGVTVVIQRDQREQTWSCLISLGHKHMYTFTLKYMPNSF